MKKISSITHPKYWPARAALFCLKLFTRLPLRAQTKLGSALGTILYYLPTQLKHITEVNISLCFPELTPVERKKLIRKNFSSLGIGFMEAAIAWWVTDARMDYIYEAVGYEHLDKALAKNKGVILVGPHVACLEMIGRLFGNQYDFAVMYRPHKNPVVAAFQEQFRHKCIHYIPRHNMRELIRSLEQNKAIWYAYDVDGGAKRSVFAPFFDISTASLTAISRIISLTGAAVIPIRFSRRDDHSGYDMLLTPELENFPSGDWVADATRLNQHLEQAIREKPEQYIWQYKRFKTRPAGEKRFY